MPLNLAINPLFSFAFSTRLSSFTTFANTQSAFILSISVVKPESEGWLIPNKFAAEDIDPKETLGCEELDLYSITCFASYVGVATKNR